MSLKNCPSCGGDKVSVKGNKLTCITCNVTYDINVDGSAKAIDLDPLKKLKDEVKEELRSELQPKPAAGDDLSGDYSPGQSDFNNVTEDECPDGRGFVDL